MRFFNRTPITRPSRLLGEAEILAVSGGIGDPGLQSGAQMSMLSLQSLVSKRSIMVQLTNNIMGSISDGAKAIARNIK